MMNELKQSNVAIYSTYLCVLNLILHLPLCLSLFVYQVYRSSKVAVLRRPTVLQRSHAQINTPNRLGTKWKWNVVQHY